MSGINTTFYNTHAKGLKLKPDGSLHSVFYVHRVLGGVKQLEDNKIFRVKPGISILDSKEDYFSQRGTNELVGKEMMIWDHNFIDQNLTFNQAKKIINLTDKLFKSRMIELGYNSRTIHGKSIKSTEAVECNISYEHIVNKCDEIHKECYKIAYEYITKSLLTPNIHQTNKFSYREGQYEYFVKPLVDRFIELSKESFNLVKLCAKATGGSGKTFLSYMVGLLLSKHFKTPFKVIGVGNSVGNTVQLVQEFAKFYELLTGKKLLKLYFIGSAPVNNFALYQSWAETLPISNSKRALQILRDFTSTKEDVAIFIVNQSTSEFLNICTDNSITFSNTFKFLDEIQQYSSETGRPKTELNRDTQIIHPKFDILFKNSYALSVSATPIIRGSESAQDQSAVFNSDIDRFGTLEVNIDYQLARELKWNCDIEILVAPIPLNTEIADAYEDNLPISINLQNQTYPMRPSVFLGSEAINFAIQDYRTHILLLTSFIPDVKDLADFLRARQSAGLLDSSYEILEGYSEKANYTVNRFNSLKKVILISNRWIGVGHDTVECDCVIPLYIPGNQWYVEQFFMRAMRIKKDGRGSLIVYVGPEQVQNAERTWNNPIWNFIESHSNGAPAQIISQAQFRDARTRVIGGTRNPSDGTSIESNVRILRNDRSNPVAFIDYEKATEYCIQRKWTDDDGNSNWLELFGHNIIYTQDFLKEELKKYSSLRELHKIYSEEGVATGMTMKAAVRRWNKKYPGFEEECFSHMWDWQTINYPSKDIIEDIINKYKCKTTSDLLSVRSSEENYSGDYYYRMIFDLGLSNSDFFDIEFTFTKDKSKITQEMIDIAFTIAKKYKTLSDFRKHDSGAFIFGKRHGYLEKMTSHMDRPYIPQHKKEKLLELKIKSIWPQLMEVKEKGGAKRKYIKQLVNDDSLFLYLHNKGYLKGVLIPSTGSTYTEITTNTSGSLQEIVKKLNLLNKHKYIKGYVERAAKKGTPITDNTNPLYGLHFKYID